MVSFSWPKVSVPDEPMEENRFMMELLVLGVNSANQSNQSRQDFGLEAMPCFQQLRE